MVHLSRIYTKTGDDGSTGLGDGSRVPKQSARVTSYGDADELGAVIGVGAVHASGEILAALRRIQNDLFDVGADLCLPLKKDEKEGEALRVKHAQVERLEAEIDELNEGLPPLDSFILSGGSPLGAHLHLARCVARRCERHVCMLAEDDEVNREVILYLNRLSDLLFVMARHVNKSAGTEVLWRPGGEA